MMTRQDAEKEVSDYYNGKLYPHNLPDYEDRLIDDLLYAVNNLGYIRNKIPLRSGNDGTTNHKKFDWFYTAKDKKPDLRYVISPYNWIPLKPKDDAR